MRDALAGRMGGAPVAVSVSFPPVVLALADIVDLRPGDVVPLDHRVDAPLEVSVGGVPRFSARPGRRGKRLACVITSVAPRRLHDPRSRSVAAPAAVDEALAAAAGAACDALPADVEWSGQTADGAAPAVPGAGAQAVAATLPGLGRLVLAVAAPLARAVQVGPPPAEDLLDGLRPAFIAAAAAFGVRWTALADYGGSPSAALRPGAGEEAHGLLLLDGDTHKASLAFIAPAAVPAGRRRGRSRVRALPAPAGPSGGRRHGRAVAGGPIELLHEVEMGVTVELGRTRMLVRDILDLSPGSVIELDRAAGSAHRRPGQRHAHRPGRGRRHRRGVRDPHHRGHRLRGSARGPAAAR